MVDPISCSVVFYLLQAAWIIDLVSSEQIDSAAAKLKAVVRKTDTIQVINWSAAAKQQSLYYYGREKRVITAPIKSAACWENNFRALKKLENTNFHWTQRNLKQLKKSHAFLRDPVLMSLAKKQEWSTPSSFSF